MQGGSSISEYSQTRELSHLLMLYYRAKELNISMELLFPDEFILTDDEPAQPGIIAEFEHLARIAEEFDSLFGTHYKIIATLEKYE